MKAKLVRSVWGIHGGYLLSKPPSRIRLIEIITALESSIAPAECVDDPEMCDRNNGCVTREIFAEMKEATTKVLKRKTLQDLIKRSKRRKKRS